MAWYVGLEYDTYEEARADFTWDFPDDYNIARDFLRKHDDPTAPALYFRHDDGDRTYSFADLDDRSSQLANALADRGIGYGDRVAVILPQAPENPITHLACWKLGAISVAMSVLFGPDSIAYRLQDSGAKVVIADTDVVDTVRAAAESCPGLDAVIEVGGTGDDSFAETVAGQSADCGIAATDAETPAIILYTSGSTGPPKGVLHSHALWVGTSTSFLMYFERDIADGVFWTPADWAWIGALGNVTFPPLHFGRPMVGSAGRSFDPEDAFSLMADLDVTHAFIPPTALRMMREVECPADRYDLDLSVIASGSEPLTPEIVDWVEQALPGVTINELYGQTEANVFVSTCQGWFDQQLGKIGKPVPGHEMAVLDPETGDERPTGEVGEIAIRYEDDPMVYQEYWNNPEATAASRLGEWHLTGDLGRVDEAGYVSFQARTDDVINTSGYRVGPGEIESVLLRHPAVAQVGVIGVPDEDRGEIVKAYVQLVDGYDPSEDLKEDLRDRVRTEHSKYAYPRAITFVESLPTTTTGKVKRRALGENDSD